MKKKQRYLEAFSDFQPENSPKVSFESWFMIKVAENKSLKRWQLEQLKAFMKSQGLEENEKKETYDKAYQCF
jgi:hypothetical protein